MVCISKRDMESYLKTEFDMNEIIEKLRLFMDNEAKSCSMDYGCITPLYVYRMWGGKVALDDITKGLREIHNGCR